MAELPILAENSVFFATAKPSIKPTEATNAAVLQKDHQTHSLIDVLLNKGPFKDNFQDPNYLPTVDEVKHAFTGIDIQNSARSAWDTFSRDHLIYELPTKEYINALGAYLKQRIELLQQADSTKPAQILEVGAGDGKLSHFIQEKLNELGMKDRYSLHVTDDKSWKTGETPFPVEPLSYEDAIHKYNPDIIIASWIPYNQDWTPAFRKHPSVSEYILLGEDGANSCNGTDATWGVDGKFYNQPPLIEKDGFHFRLIDVKNDADNTITWPNQISHLEKYAPGEGYCSKTISFRREHSPLGKIHTANQ